MTKYAELVLSVSGELATLSEHDVDQSIERALGRAGELAHADRCYVFLLSDTSPPTVSNTHEWCGPGIEPAREFLQDLSVTHFPWAFSIIHSGDELRVPAVTDAPPGPEKEEWERESIRSLFCTPFRIAGQPAGFIGCDWVARADPLTAETMQMIRVAGTLVAGALERRRAFRAIEYRSRFEEVVLRISSKFIHVRGDALAPAIQEALEVIARFVGVESGYLFEVEGATVHPRFAWAVAPLAPPRAEDSAGVPPADVASALVRLSGGQPQVTSTLEELPEPGLRAALAAMGVGAFVDVPILTAGRLTAVVGFATARRPRPWTGDEVKLLQLAGQVFGNALARAEAERTEARLQAQLLQTQKLDVVGQLAGGVAHDFNNLLLSITVAADIALRTVPPEDGPSRQALEEIHFAADRAAALTRQLLTFSRRSVVQVGPVDLNRLIDEMLRMIRRVVRESIEIDFRPGEGLDTVEGDEGQLEQILMNLCVNASDAMPTGGRLTIETLEVVRREPEADRWVRLSVRDSGTGMEESLRERIFEPFFTTKPPGKGAGLGLSTVYGIVQQHRGRIAVASTPGVGSTFEVDFPAFARPSQAPRREPEGAPEGGPETVLIAEDDESVRRIVSALLERAGYRVLTAQDGEHAVQVFREASPPVDLVLMDAVMPRKSGLEAYRELVQLDPDVRVLFSSGYSTTVFPDGFFDDGEHQLLEKPYDGAVLLRRIREMLDREAP